jgi:hypothetical protein
LYFGLSVSSSLAYVRNFSGRRDSLFSPWVRGCSRSAHRSAVLRSSLPRVARSRLACPNLAPSTLAAAPLHGQGYLQPAQSRAASQCTLASRSRVLARAVDSGSFKRNGPSCYRSNDASSSAVRAYEGISASHAFAMRIQSPRSASVAQIVAWCSHLAAYARYFSHLSMVRSQNWPSLVNIRVRNAKRRGAT